MVTLKKSERLHSKKLIEELFLKGKSFLSYPLKVVYLEGYAPAETPVQAAFSVSKRLFKKAVSRNQIKRRIKEAYRLNKPAFCAALKEKNMAVMFIYIAKENLPYSETEKGMKKALKKLTSMENKK